MLEELVQRRHRRVYSGREALGKREGKLAKIVIIGGGVIGSSIAYHLAQAGDASDVVVVEPDPTYDSPPPRAPPAASVSSTRYLKISACRSMGTKSTASSRR
jgi:NADPH-dependent 2,4-dienoyl-CoA reductase/sulfur reductase-like enzyme